MPHAPPATQRRILLLLGPPRVGKTTVVQKVIAALKIRCGGFYTQADQKAYRTDFRMVTVRGRHRSIATRPLLRRFEIEALIGFDLSVLEETALDALRWAMDRYKVLIIDQIGTYECQSERFRALVSLALESGRVVILSATPSDHPFLASIKARPDVEVLSVTMANRSTIPASIARKVMGMAGGEGGGRRMPGDPARESAATADSCPASRPGSGSASGSQDLESEVGDQAGEATVSEAPGEP